MLTDLWGDIAIVPVHGHTILIFKTDICNACLNIHPREIMASSLSIGCRFIRYLYIIIYWDYDIDICFFANLNPTTSGLSIRAFIFILLQEFWNYKQYNLLVTILRYLFGVIFCVQNIRYSSFERVVFKITSFYIWITST